ncbi:unnamed protein product [Fusarium langsethiae]|nr:unnamed protein product [Fusarium langsethiae]GKU21044.1 unnamed protein product [Fusarium langsethiae]
MASQEQPLPLPPPSPSLLPPPPLPPQEFPLQRLPPELRDHIWTLTLRGRRAFSVKRISRKDYTTDTKFFDFFAPLHPPPRALSVCRESRAVALRRGFFFSVGDNPDTKKH